MSNYKFIVSLLFICSISTITVASNSHMLSEEELSKKAFTLKQQYKTQPTHMPELQEMYEWVFPHFQKEFNGQEEKLNLLGKIKNEFDNDFNHTRLNLDRLNYITLQLMILQDPDVYNKNLRVFN